MPSTTLPPSVLSSKRQLATHQSALAKHPPESLFWRPRTCFRPPTAAVWETAGSLARAADALLAGNRDEAIRHIEEAQRADMLTWGVPVMSTVNPDIIRWRPIDETALPKRGRVGNRDPNRKLLDTMYRRDGWRCRFCGSPVIIPEARTRMGKLLPGIFRWTNAYGDHAGFMILSGVADHVQPHSWSGPTSLDNLVSCCAPCNYGRGSAFLAEMGLIDPRERDPYPADGWNGLCHVLAIPAPQLAKEPVLPPRPNMTVWAQFAHLVKCRRETDGGV